MAENNLKAIPGSATAFAACSSYDPAAVDGAVAGLWAQLGGPAAFVRGKHVLLKPNFLAARPLAKGVVTHPEVIRAVAAAALGAGASSVVVGDSPAVGRAARVARRIGLPALLDPLGVEVIEFDSWVSWARPGGGEIKIARRVLEAEALINLAKLKTHSLCGLTMAVKNCFGAVPGLGKARWHVRHGQDVISFARMLADVCRAVSPCLSLVDAIDSMDGEGPSSGRVRRTGFLAAGRDPFRLDRQLARVCGVPDQWVVTFAVDGLDSGAGEADQASGAGGLAVADWRMPRRFQSGKTPPPRFSRKRCTACGQCVEMCQAGALDLSSGQVRLNAAACIRCYCCHEICPERAIRVGRRWWWG